MLVNTFLASLAAKLAMATGLAVAAVSAAGAAGVLPDPAQHAVASVIQATTPFSIPDAATAADEVVGDVDQVIDQVTTTTTLGTTTTLAGADDNESDGTRKENHGACVSTVAKNTPAGPDHGKTVSSVARSDCGKTTSTTVTTVAPTTTSTSTTVAGLNSANSGKGNSGNSSNNGKGKSGKN